MTHATPGFMASVSEMAIGFMIDLGRQITQLSDRISRGPEAEPRRWAVQLHGATVGIMGYGAIGAHLAPICVALGMTVLVSDPFEKVDDDARPAGRLSTRCSRQSDFVVCLVVANEETENLMNAANFAG